LGHLLPMHSAANVRPLYARSRTPTGQSIPTQ
jgi:hypothetical protein